MIAIRTRKIVGAVQAAAHMRRLAAEACIQWQAAHLAGCPAEVVEAAEREYLRLLQQAKLWEGR